jgi:radical SAM protein with 4Fe4S-binding SPASM domain
MDLSWVDGFIAQAGRAMFLREEDRLLIVAPNKSFKLNASAIAVLGPLLAGATLAQALPGIEKDAEKSRDVDAFFRGLRGLISGRFGESGPGAGVEVKPFARPHNTLPVLSEIAVTYRCNLDCVFCYAACSCVKADSGYEMTLEEIKKILGVIRHQAKAPTVSFTGGEPTLRDDLPRMIAHAASLGLRTNLITNGSAINAAKAAALKEAGLLSAQVSIEGPDAAIHEAMTKKPGSFSATLRGYSALAAAGIHVHPHLTITRINAGRLLDHVDFLKGLGAARFSMNQLIPIGSGAAREDIWIRYSEIGPMIEAVRRKSRRAGIEFMWYSPTPLCMYNPIAAGLGNKSCAACDGLLSVAPDGGVLPCSSFQRNVGNLLTEDFHSIWGGQKARFWGNKDYAPARCRTCADFDACACACPLYWDAVGHGELVEAWNG